MSLPPVIYRDIGEEVPAAERIIYAAVVRHLDAGANPVRAVIRAAADTGVSRQRVWSIVRQYEPDVFRPGPDGRPKGP